MPKEIMLYPNNAQRFRVKEIYHYPNTTQRRKIKSIVYYPNATDRHVIFGIVLPDPPAGFYPNANFTFSAVDLGGGASGQQGSTPSIPENPSTPTTVNGGAGVHVGLWDSPSGNYFILVYTGLSGGDPSPGMFARMVLTDLVTNEVTTFLRSAAVATPPANTMQWTWPRHPLVVGRSYLVEFFPT